MFTPTLSISSSIQWDLGSLPRTPHSEKGDVQVKARTRAAVRAQVPVTPGRTVQVSPGGPERRRLTRQCSANILEVLCIYRSLNGKFLFLL